MWLFCLGRTPGATPDEAPCCCTPLSCRWTDSSQRLWGVHHKVYNQTIALILLRRRGCHPEAKLQTTATDPPSFSHTGKAPQHLAMEGDLFRFGDRVDSEWLCYKKKRFAIILRGSSEPSSSISRTGFCRSFALSSRRFSVRQRCLCSCGCPSLFAKPLIYNSILTVALRPFLSGMLIQRVFKS